MTSMDWAERARLWSESADAVTRDEIAAMGGDADSLRDAFYRDLEFGTAGLRGIVGAGTNRMNTYTVGRATQGFAQYLLENFEAPTVALARDSRHGGEEFVRFAAAVLAANGVRAMVYPRIEPTPALSFAVRDLGCSGGINVTASHNPAAYNGYKVYGPDGCQITSEAAAAISRSIAGVDYFSGIKHMDFDAAVEQGLVLWIGDDTIDRFIDAVACADVAGLIEQGEGGLDGGGDSNGGGEQGSAEDAVLSVVYTPLNGTGLECVSRILDRIGVDDVTVVPEQAQPDGDFPTCPYPNPEFREALEKGIELCEAVHPDLLLATDPDADRVGTAVKDAGDYTLISGNEMGALLLNYVAHMRKAAGQDLSACVAVTTIVSSTMIDAIAADYGFELRRVLTGFKYIGEQIGMLEAAGEQDRFIFGFEESYGYLAGAHVRDKDAIVASMLICQMARWYKARGMNLAGGMRELYERYGHYKNRTVNVAFEGPDGAAEMQEIMSRLRASKPAAIAGHDIVACVDYAEGAPMPLVNAPAGQVRQTLPRANVLEMELGGGNKVIVRPSGTEPKVKAYLFAKDADPLKADALLDAMEAQARELLSI